ncbi:putative diguanylate cyclase YcdT [Vibrio thalassae]|uniref:diguanylate cyclase n=1 Tax=Vibrio thalassae TaxID=1243014 RepID=A0A240EHN9_9VIBR|nr:GGDEF domain-containing protein [Vibrio thalassae]SNX48217.1 putative diguanylate cyclase YcdT [Vibrio thalassae]
MDAFSLDMRTLNFIIILFSCVYCVGLLLYQRSQQKVAGLTMFSLALLVMGAGPLLISFRGLLPDSLSIITANMMVTCAFQMILHSLCEFRQAQFKYSYWCMATIPLVCLFFVYFTYFQPSIENRIVVSAVYLSLVTFASAKVMLIGKQDDLPLAVRTMAMTFILYGLFMVYRGYYAIGESVAKFMDAGVVHALAFLFSIFLIVAISFSMLWMINGRQVQAIYALSYFDPLTQLGNRRALEVYIEDDLPKHLSTGTVSIIMLDIDYFKIINDRYGHIVGDKVIRKVSEIIQDSLQPDSATFRFGGDEIMVVLYDMDLHQARALAERLRNQIETYGSIKGQDFSVSCSFGVAQLVEGEPWDSLVGRADNALYQAKESGRSQVCSCNLTSSDRCYS